MPKDDDMNKVTNVLQVGLGNAHILREATLSVPQRKSLRIDYHRVKSRMFGGGIEMATEMSFHDLGKYDIVHNLSQHPLFPRKRNKITLVTTAHELQEIQFPELTPLLTTGIKSKMWRRTITMPGIRCLLKSDYATVTSLLLKDGLVGAGFPKDKIFMTPLGIDRSFISGKKVRRGRSMKGFRVGTVGTIGAQKNTFFSIDAVKQLEGDDISFEIWGKSVYSEAELAGRIGADSRISVKGYVPQEKKLSIYDSFDVFLFPSIFEGFGIPIIEAKARGLPVILFKNGHISPELREYCFEAKSAAHMAEIVQDIKDNGYDPKMRKRAVESASKFTMERMGKSILDAYQSIADGL